MNASSLRPEVVAQNPINKVGLGNPDSIGCPLGKLLILVGDDDRFVLVWKGPGAHITVQIAALARMALHIVALLTKRLPIIEIVRAVASSRNLVVRAELYLGLLPSTRSAPVPVLFLDLFPHGFAGLCPWFSLRANFQALQLIANALLGDTSEPLIALQLAQAPEHILVRWLPTLSAKSVDSGAHVVLGQQRARNAVAFRPKSIQDHRIIQLVRRTRRDKTGRCIGEPFLSSFFGVIRRHSRCDHESSAGARLTHLGARL